MHDSIAGMAHRMGQEGATRRRRTARIAMHVSCHGARAVDRRRGVPTEVGDVLGEAHTVQYHEQSGWTALWSLAVGVIM